MKAYLFHKRLHLLAILVLIGGMIAASPLSAGQTRAGAAKLPACGADLTQTTVSGLSSGGFMTAQFHVAYSNTIVGAGIIAGGPYYCSGSNEFKSDFEDAVNTCMSPKGRTGPNGEKLFEKAKGFAKMGWIDPLTNLKDDRVYIFSGASDRTVLTKVVNETEDFYRAAEVPLDNIQYDIHSNAGHAIITNEEEDVPCAQTRSPFINDCDFIQSHDILRHLYGELNPPATILSSRVVKFDQSEFIKEENMDLSCMSKNAYVYIPKSCEGKKCRVHVVFHGCGQGAKAIGDDYYMETGYNELADTNDIIILYPQAERSIPENPMGCWDFWGYSSRDLDRPDFYKKSAPQMTAVMEMLNRLGEPRK